MLFQLWSWSSPSTRLYVPSFLFSFSARCTAILYPCSNFEYRNGVLGWECNCAHDFWYEPVVSSEMLQKGLNNSCKVIGTGMDMVVLPNIQFKLADFGIRYCCCCCRCFDSCPTKNAKSLQAFVECGQHGISTRLSFFTRHLIRMMTLCYCNAGLNGLSCFKLPYSSKCVSCNFWFHLVTFKRFW